MANQAHHRPIPAIERRQKSGLLKLAAIAAMSTGEAPAVKSKLPNKLTLRQATGEVFLRILTAFSSPAASTSICATLLHYGSSQIHSLDLVHLGTSDGFDAGMLRELAEAVEQNTALIERAWNEHFS